MPRLPELVVDALATHRLVRLLQRDTLRPIADVRNTVIGRWPDHPLTELLACPWCAGVHVAALTQAARELAPRVWPRLAVVLAASTVAGLIADWEDR